jgi:hypothetical protein
LSFWWGGVAAPPQYHGRAAALPCQFKRTNQAANDGGLNFWGNDFSGI